MALPVLTWLPPTGLLARGLREAGRAAVLRPRPPTELAAFLHTDMFSCVCHFPFLLM